MSDDQLTAPNTGFIAVDPKPTDFIAGAETGILETPVLPSCDWHPYLPTNVTQLMKTSDGFSKGDTNACVSFGAKQSVETQLNLQIKNGTMSADNLAWLKNNGYIDANGSVLLSARFTAKKSGTIPAQGNSLPNVWASLKNDGAVPEALYPMPTKDFDAFLAQNGSLSMQQAWDIYYAEIPDSLILLGQQFKERFPILYEWLVYPAAPASGAALRQFLNVSPLEIATAVCGGWNTDDPIQACGAGTAHATMLVSVEQNGFYDILDHYVPFLKQFAAAYTITYGMRGVVGQTLAPAPVGFQYTFTKQLTYKGTANDPAELHALQQALQYLKNKAGKPYMTPGLFGIFGDATRAALGAFQTDRGIKDPGGQGVDFGPQSRAAMNAALLNQK